MGKNNKKTNNQSKRKVHNTPKSHPKPATKVGRSRTKNIGGIPVATYTPELKELAKKQKRAGTGVYLVNNESDCLKSKHTNNQYTLPTPKKTITTSKTPTLYVYKGYLTINKEHLIDYYLIVDDIEHKNKMRIVVAHDTETSRYYVSATQIARLHKQSLFPDIIVKTTNLGSEPMYGENFRQYSELALYGYKVGKTGLPASKRHRILSHIIDNKILRKYEIISLLNGNITLREERTDRNFSKAIKDWKEDIEFVDNY